MRDEKSKSDVPVEILVSFNLKILFTVTIILVREKLNLNLSSLSGN